ncbi:putative ribonuclease H-like domain-containing protein, partial [Tanacetum coccineum]
LDTTSIVADLSLLLLTVATIEVCEYCISVVGNGYQEKDKIKTKQDKAEHEIGPKPELGQRDTSFKDSEINTLKSEIEKLKKDKECNKIKINKFENASKSLDKSIGSQISDNIRKGVGFVSYNVVPPPPTGLFSPPTIDVSNSGLEKFQQPKFEGYGPKASKSVYKDTSNEVKKTPDAPLGKKLVSEKEKQTAHCNYHQREGMVNGNNYTRVNYNYSAKKAYPNSHRNMTPRAVLMKTGLKPLNIARPVNTAYPKTTVYSARPMSCFSKLAQSTVKRPYQSRTALTNKNFNQKVNTAKEKVYTAKPKSVNIARPTSALVNAVRANQFNVVKASACWVWRPTKLNSASITFKRENYIDARGRSKHMTSNMSYLSDFKEFNGRYVTFMGGARGGRITGKGTLKTSKIDFEDNMVIIVKPHNKTPYELFRGRTPALSFMRPFGCHVTILNTLDHLGKFDGKSDDGFFVGYSLTSKAFRVYNIRTRKVEENLHIRFLENKPIVTGDGPKWLFDIDSLTKSMNYVPVVAGTNSNDFAGSEESNGAGHTSKETEFSQDYIVMPLWKDGLMFDSPSKNFSDDEPQPSSNAKNKDDEGVSKPSGFSDQEQLESSTPNINTDGPSINTSSVNFKTGSLNINIVSPTVITTRSNCSQNVSDIFSLGRSATLEATHADLFGDETEMDMSNLTTSYQFPTTLNTRIHKDYSLDHVIGDIQSGVQTRGMTKNTNEHGFISAVYEGKTHEDLHTCLFACFLSHEESKRIAKALSDPAWVEAMQEELLQFKLQKFFASVARIEAIRLFLAYASFMSFMVYQMDVKSAFFYGIIEEEVYVCQPLGFEDPDYPDKFYKVVKALYGLHQAPRAWYGTLAKYLLDNRFQRGKINQTLFIKKQKGDILLVQVYVDDIIFGSTNKELCTEFEKLMYDKFQMSSIGELNFFLGLQVKQREDGIFISQDKYVADILRKFCFTDVRTASTPMDTEKPLLKDLDGDDVDVRLYRSMIGSLMYLTSSRPDIMFAICACAKFQVTPRVLHSHAVKRIFRYLKGQPKLGLWYPRNSPFDLVAYSYSDYAGTSLDRKSTIGGCYFLRCKLISWQCKKQTVVATSSTEAEYVVAASCCGQVLWIQNQMLDYGYNFMRTMINIDNNSTICIVKNPVSHTKTKHIEIRYHFIRECYDKKLIQVVKIHTDHNFADLLTKALDIGRLGILSIWKLKRGRDTKIPQSSGPPEKVGDEAVHKELGDRMERAVTTASSLEAEHDSGSGPRDNILGSGEDNMKLMALMEHYTKLSELFWQTASASTLENGDMEITATIDGKVKVLFEASIRRHLKLEDSDGISTLPTTEIFEQLALMGKRDCFFLTKEPILLLPGQILQGEGSTIPVESHHTPTVAPSTSQPHHSPTLRNFIRQETKVPQPSFPTQTHVADKAASIGVDDRHGGASTTVSGLEVGQGSGNIHKTPTMPHDLPLPRVHTLGRDEGRMQPNELMELVTKLSDKVAVLENDLKQTKKTYGVAFYQTYQKGQDFGENYQVQQSYKKRSICFTDPEEVYTAEPDISTANVPVSIAGAEVSIAAESLVYIRRSAVKRKDNGKAIMEESEPTQTKTKIQQEQERLGFEEAQRLQEQFDEEERQRIANVHIEADEEWDNIQAQIEADEELAHRLQAQEREGYSEADKEKLLHMGSHILQQLRGYSFDEIKDLFEATVKRVNTFTLMESDDTVPKVVAGSSKRSAEEELGEESSKRQKIGEGSEPAEESKDKESDELSQEQLQQLIIIVPEEGMNVEALQTKYPIIDWENFNRDDLVKLWDLVRERFSSTEPTDDKERALWVELKRLFEPDTDDLLEL